MRCLIFHSVTFYLTFSLRCLSYIYTVPCTNICGAQHSVTLGHLLLLAKPQLRLKAWPTRTGNCVRKLFFLAVMLRMGWKVLECAVSSVLLIDWCSPPRSLWPAKQIAAAYSTELLVSSILFSKTSSFLGAFAKLREATINIFILSDHLSVSPRVTTRLPLDRFL